MKDDERRRIVEAMQKAGHNVRLIDDAPAMIDDPEKRKKVEAILAEIRKPSDYCVVAWRDPADDVVKLHAHGYRDFVMALAAQGIMWSQNEYYQSVVRMRDLDDYYDCSTQAEFFECVRRLKSEGWHMVPFLDDNPAATLDPNTFAPPPPMRIEECDVQRYSDLPE